MNEFKSWNWSCEDCTTTSESKNEDISYCCFLPSWTSGNEFGTLSHTADCLLREPSELFSGKETTEHDERVNEPSYVLWRVIFDIADKDWMFSK